MLPRFVRSAIFFPPSSPSSPYIFQPFSFSFYSSLSSSTQLFVVISAPLPVVTIFETLIFDNRHPQYSIYHQIAPNVARASQRRQPTARQAFSRNKSLYSHSLPKISLVMAATPTARDSTSTEVRRRISRVSTPGSARDMVEGRQPVNKKVKMLATATTCGDDAGPLFVGESRGPGNVPAAIMVKGKASQTAAQQNVGYLGTLLFSAQLHIEPMVAEINILYFKFDHRCVPTAYCFEPSLLTSNFHSKRSLKHRGPPRNYIPAIRHRNPSETPGAGSYRAGNCKNPSLY